MVMIKNDDDSDHYVMIKITMMMTIIMEMMIMMAMTMITMKLDMVEV